MTSHMTLEVSDGGDPRRVERKTLLARGERLGTAPSLCGLLRGLACAGRARSRLPLQQLTDAWPCARGICIEKSNDQAGAPNDARVEVTAAGGEGAGDRGEEDMEPNFLVDIERSRAAQAQAILADIDEFGDDDARSSGHLHGTMQRHPHTSSGRAACRCGGRAACHRMDCGPHCVRGNRAYLDP